MTGKMTGKIAGDAALNAWSASVRRVKERYPNPHYLVPGHGPVDQSGSAYKKTLDLLQSGPNGSKP